ncbi:MAG: GNAT family N-acetyltransferase [Candidatus Zixiibacteriota bacterium]|nr:MAG: GNAT family N-acetyltransferase [candidate division Zixibacteria bacterium]
MNKVKKIPFTDIEKFIDILADAYPGIGITTPEDKKRVKERFRKRSKDKRMSWWGVYRGSELLGGAIFYDFTMNFFGNKVLAGGLGTVCVSLVHKKEHVARDLMRFYLRHYRKREATFSVLWPFRPDFYKQMGCGLGSTNHVYKVKPADLPRGKSKKNVRFLGKADMKALNDCYNRYVDRHTGMIEETLVNRKIRFDLSKETKFVGVEKKGRIEGYMIFSFVRGNAANFVDNHIKVSEMIYETPEALSELMTFLHTQADQINRIIFHTDDPDFYHYVKDPRNDSGNLAEPVYHESHVSGVGIMFRVLNTRQIFGILEKHNFNGQTLRLKLNVRDSFLRENNSSLVIHFEDGRPFLKTKNAAADVTLELNIADFSSLILGAVGLRSLFQYGFARISKPDYLNRLHRLFATEEKPICTTSF